MKKIEKNLNESIENIDERKIKKFTDMFKNIKNAMGAAGPLGLIFEAMEFLAPIMEALQPVLDVINALFQRAAAEILPQLMEVFDPLMTAFMDLMPVFADLGVVIGEILVAFLDPLVDLFVEFIPIIGMLMELLIPAMEALVPVISLVGEAISFLIEGAFKGLAIAIFWVGETIFAIIDAFTFGPIEARGAFREFFAELFTILDVELPDVLKTYAPTEPVYGLPTPAPYQLLSLQGGGIAPRPITAEIGHGPKGEIIYPLDKWERQQLETNWLLEVNNDLLTRILADKEWRHR